MRQSGAPWWLNISVCQWSSVSVWMWADRKSEVSTCFLCGHPGSVQLRTGCPETGGRTYNLLSSWYYHCWGGGSVYRFKRGRRIGCSIGLFELWWTQRCSSYENTSVDAWSNNRREIREFAKVSYVNYVTDFRETGLWKTLRGGV